MQGKIFYIKVENEYIKCETNCSLNITKETINKSNRSNGKYRAYRSGYISWSMNLDSKTTISEIGMSTNKLIDAILNKDTVEVMFGGRINDVDILECWGEAVIVSLDINAPAIGESTSNIMFQGSGELKTRSNSFWKIINAMPAKSDKNKIVDTRTWN